MAFGGLIINHVKLIQHNLLNHEKSLMFKYGRTQRKIPSRLVCGSHGTCPDARCWGSSHLWAGIVKQKENNNAIINSPV